MPFDFAVFDEAQDVSVAQLRFLAALGTGKANSLFLPATWVNASFNSPSHGRLWRRYSRTLTHATHQLPDVTPDRTQADRLLGPELFDVDGITEERAGTISVFNGPFARQFEVLKSPEEESQHGRRMATRTQQRRSYAARNRCFCPVATELDRAREAVKYSGLSFKVLDENRNDERSRSEWRFISPKDWSSCRRCHGV